MPDEHRRPLDALLGCAEHAGAQAAQQRGGQETILFRTRRGVYLTQWDVARLAPRGGSVVYSYVGKTANRVPYSNRAIYLYYMYRLSSIVRAYAV